MLTALSGQEGLALACEEEPDLILLDIVMPEMDGFTVCRRLKKDKELCDIPVVFITAIKDDPLSRITALECGAEAFLSKPVDKSELTAQIRAMFKIRTANLEKRNEKERLARLVEHRTQTLKKEHQKTLTLLDSLTREVENRKKIEQELLASNAFFELMFNTSPDAVSLSLLDNGLFIHINDGFTKLFGYTQNEVAGRHPFDLSLYYEPGQRERYITTLKKNGHCDDFETIFRRKDGSTFYGWLASKVVKINGVDHVASFLRNISDWKMMERALRQSEEKYRHITENMSDVVWTTDMNLIPTYISPSVERLYGESAEENMKRTLTDRFSPDMAKRFRAALAEALEEEKDPQCDKSRTRIFEAKHNRADGSAVWVSMHVSFLRDESGKPVGFLGVSRDITARKLAEDALIESEHRYSSYIQNAPDGIFVADERGRYVEVNRAASEVTGYTNAELLTMSIPDILADESVESGLRGFRTLKNTGRIHGVYLHKHKNGAKRWLTLDAVKYSENRYIGFTKDITEQKQAEDALRQSEERFQLLFNKAPLGYQSLDVKGRFLDVNQQWLDTLGYTRGEVIGKSFSDFIVPHQQAHFMKSFDQFKSQGSTHREFEMRHKSGRILSMALEGKTAYDEEGNFKQTHCILQDITEQKKAQKALQESEEKYRLLVTQMLQGLAVHEIILDADGKPADYRFLDVNKGFENLTGLCGKDIIGKTVLEVMPETERFWIEKYGQVALTGQPLVFEDYAYELGKYYEVVAYSTQPMQFATIFTDITERKKAEANLIFMNQHDYMTGLHNRRFWENEAKRLDRRKNLPLSVLLGDINGVKMINDAFGHAQGDRLIKDTAAILASCCPESAVLARTGGDEFSILLPGAANDAASSLIGRIQDACDKHNAGLSNEAFYINISLGFSTKESMDQPFSDVMKTAENQMYQAQAFRA